MAKYGVYSLQLGAGPERDLRVAALKSIAAEAGYAFGAEPSVSLWLQHIADERIAQDRTGYYAVLVEGDGARHLEFLARRPPHVLGARIPFGKLLANEDACETRRFLATVTQEGARSMLREYGAAISENDPVLHDTLYPVPGAASAQALRALPPAQSGSRIHSRFQELLHSKGQRDSTSYSPADVAKRTGLASTAVENFALDRVSGFNPTTVDALCHFFGCTLDDLLYIQNEVSR